MTVTQPPAAAPPGSGSEPPVARTRLGPWRAGIVSAVIALVAGGGVGYALGSHDTSHTHVLVGRAYHSATQAAVRVDGRSYGFEITANGMNWYDARGAQHEGGIPPCLQQPGYSWIRFGYSTAAGLHGESWRSVDWVECVQHP